MGDISVSMARTSLTLDHGRGSLTASVTNRGTTTRRVILAVVPAPGHQPVGSATEVDPRAWATVRRPLGEIGPGATQQYVVDFDAPPGPAGTYALRVIAHPADRAPDEHRDPGRTFRVAVPPSAAPPSPADEPHLYLGVLAFVVAVSAFAVVLLVYTLARGG